MLQRITACIVLVAALPLAPVQARAATDQHSRTWNAFVDQLYDLHKRTIAEHQTREERRIGGYFRHPEYYEEVKYFDRASGQLLSMVQWERPPEGGWLEPLLSLFQDPPPLESRDRLHSIAVYVYDDQGRVLRDYSATFLPDYRGAPTQTLIFLHAYPGDLHAMRSYDASGNLTYESCEGSLNGSKVEIDLDEDQMALERDKADGIMHSAAYRSCFGSLSQEAGEYLEPH
jgi:hypothetical protein